MVSGILWGCGLALIGACCLATIIVLAALRVASRGDPMNLPREE